jgi:hypothetical protein
MHSSNAVIHRSSRSWQIHQCAALDQLGQRLLDANRTIGQCNKITTIFSRKVTNYYKGKLQTVIEDSETGSRAFATSILASKRTFWKALSIEVSSIS